MIIMFYNHAIRGQLCTNKYKILGLEFFLGENSYFYAHAFSRDFFDIFIMESEITSQFYSLYFGLGAISSVIKPQIPGRLFSPSDICKKLSHHFLLHFPIGMGSYDHHAKYQGVFP